MRDKIPHSDNITNAILDAFRGKGVEFQRIGEEIYKRLLARATERAIVLTVDNGDGTFTHTFDFTKDAE